MKPERRPAGARITVAGDNQEHQQNRYRRHHHGDRQRNLA
jgi:hypothetical protein